LLSLSPVLVEVHLFIQTPSPHPNHRSGLGNALARAYLTRSNCTVIGSIRDFTTPSISSLKSSPTGPGSHLHLVKIESTTPQDALTAIQEIQKAGTNHIDILIANAAISPAIEPIETVDLEVVAKTFQVNTLGPLALYQAGYELIKKSNNPKFVSISSAAGTIGGMEGRRTWVAPSYCISKAGLNWVTLYVHLWCSHQEEYIAKADIC
jgi:NAD(P)-dependent dehydrogenase (short-subunit alcohol dehydrogenase family)